MSQNADGKYLPRVEFQIHFQTGYRGRRCLRSGAYQKEPDHPNEDLSRLTRLLALAHRWNHLIDKGIITNYSEIARMMGLSRARVTQIMDLLYLAPDIQEEILLPPRDGRQPPHVPERVTRQITQTPGWPEQRDLRRKARIARSHVSP